MIEFAQRSGFKVDELITKVYNDTKNLRVSEIERLKEKYIEAKLTFDKGVDMFVVLATILGPQKAYNKLGIVFAQKIEISTKTGENAILRQSLTSIIHKVMNNVKLTYFKVS